MASTQEYIDYVCAQLEGAGVVRCRRMMGEAVVYVDEKCAVMVCDDICYVKKVPKLEALMADAECGCPYEGAKEHYILDIDHRSHAVRVPECWLKCCPIRKKRHFEKKLKEINKKIYNEKQENQECVNLCILQGRSRRDR